MQVTDTSLSLQKEIYNKQQNDLQMQVVLFGAEDEIRTRDVHLGKVTLYH